MNFFGIEKLQRKRAMLELIVLDLALIDSRTAR